MSVRRIGVPDTLNHGTTVSAVVAGQFHTAIEVP
jgi:hypothetical protein